MDLTWVAIAASLLMGGCALLTFIWAVRYHQLRNFEDVKYQIFWSDLQESEEVNVKEQQGWRSSQAGTHHKCTGSFAGDGHA